VKTQTVKLLCFFPADHDYIVPSKDDRSQLTP